MDKQKEFSHRTHEPQTKLSVNTDESFFLSKVNYIFPFSAANLFSIRQERRFLFALFSSFSRFDGIEKEEQKHILIYISRV